MTTQDGSPDRPQTTTIPGGKLRQIARDHWLVECNVCPSRLGRKHTNTRREAEEWFYQKHFARESLHWKYRYPSPEAKEAHRKQRELLERIFGTDHKEN